MAGHLGLTGRTTLRGVTGVAPLLSLLVVVGRPGPWSDGTAAARGLERTTAVTCGLCPTAIPSSRQWDSFRFRVTVPFHPNFTRQGIPERGSHKELH